MLRNYSYNIFSKLVKINNRNLSSKVLGFPNIDYEFSIYEGPIYEDVKNAYEKRISPSVKPFYRTPLLINEAHAQWMWDHTGRRYLDMFGGIVTVSVGHCHPKVIAAMTEQASKLGHTSAIYMHPRYYEYAEKLKLKLPEKLNVVYLCNSGSEANELAFLMSRLYTGENNIISLRNCYHGGTYSSNAATAMSTWRYSVAQPTGHINMMNPDVYKGRWGNPHCRDCPIKPRQKSCLCEEGNCTASEKYFEELEEIFRFSLPNKGRVAGFIAESIQGIGGVVQYPKTFLKKVHRLVHQHGGLFIADEVQTGFGRTGEHFWGFEGHDIIPDIITMAKGIGNGFPLACVVTTSEIAECLKRALHFNTFGGNPVACAIGSAVLNVIEEEKLQENSHVVGTYLLNKLKNFLEEYPDIVGDVRGKGLMIGIELISDNELKKHIKSEDMSEIFEDIKNMGVLIGKGGLHGNILRIKPPMCVTKEDADFTYNVLDTALRKFRDNNLTNKK